jgi:hypothetical protein
MHIDTEPFPNPIEPSKTVVIVSLLGSGDFGVDGDLRHRRRRRRQRKRWIGTLWWRRTWWTRYGRWTGRRRRALYQSSPASPPPDPTPSGPAVSSATCTSTILHPSLPRLFLDDYLITNRRIGEVVWFISWNFGWFRVGLCTQVDFAGWGSKMSSSFYC